VARLLKLIQEGEVQLWQRGENQLGVASALYPCSFARVQVLYQPTKLVLQESDAPSIKDRSVMKWGRLSVHSARTQALASELR